MRPSNLPPGVTDRMIEDAQGHDYEYKRILRNEGTLPITWVIAAKWQHGLFGSFYTSLCEAIMKADVENAERLRAGFPDYVDAIKGWQYGMLAKEMDDYCNEESKHAE